MSKHPTSKNGSTSLTAHSSDGLTRTKSKPSVSHPTNKDFMTTIISLKLLELQNNKTPTPMLPEKESAMLESPLLIKKKISNDKLNISNQNIQTQNLSKTSDQDLIGTEKDLSPFWSKCLTEQSKKLWSPIKTDCVDSDWSCYSGYSKNVTANSWFSTNLQMPRQNSNSQKTSYPLSTTLQQKIMECEALKIKNLEYLKAKKIKLYPTTQEKQKLKQWFGASRWTYNKCLEWVKSDESKANKLNKKILREKFVNQNSTHEKPDYVKEVPYDIRDEAMADLIKNVVSNCAKVKRKTIERFNLRYRSIKYSVQSVNVRARHYTRVKGEYAFIQTMKKSESVELNHVKNDFRLVKDIYGDYWMCLPYNRERRSDRQAFTFSKYDNDGVISLDPGVRTFLTGYDGYNRNIVHLGTNQKQLEKLYKELDILERKISNKKNKETMKLRKACKAKRKRIHNLVKDMHYKIANFLCSNYKTILLPEFKTQQMVSKDGGRTISKKTVRLMNTLSHYIFRRRLIEKSQEYEHCHVIIVNESHTSKTCSGCGWVHSKLGGSKTFTCGGKCGQEMDRDVNASKNIFLKNNQ